MSAEHDLVLERLGAALEELADAEASALVAEAHAEARARVRGLLAEAIAQRLLSSAEGELDALAQSAWLLGPGWEGVGADPKPPHSSSERDATPSDARIETHAEEEGARRVVQQRPVGLGWYVYGIVSPGFAPEPVAGVDGVHELEVLTGAGLGALASRVPLDEFGEDSLGERLEDLAWLEQIARHHERILESAREQRATVVPMRLFTIYDSRTSVIEMLVREQRYLLEALERLERRTEWGVKLYLLPGAAALTETVDSEEHEHGEAGGPGASYMLRRRAADHRRERAADRLDQMRDRAHEGLSALATEARVNPLQPPELSNHDGSMLMNAVYLVDDDAVEAFAAAVADLREESAAQGIEVLLTGPWPPYNFVNSSQGADG